MKFTDFYHPVLIATSHVPELHGHVINDSGVTIGAGCSISEMVDILKEAVHILPGITFENISNLSNFNNSYYMLIFLHVYNLFNKIFQKCCLE